MCVCVHAKSSHEIEKPASDRQRDVYMHLSFYREITWMPAEVYGPRIIILACWLFAARTGEPSCRLKGLWKL